MFHKNANCYSQCKFWTLDLQQEQLYTKALRERESSLQSSEEVASDGRQVKGPECCKEKACSNQLKWNGSKCMYVNKEVPLGQHYGGESFHALNEK